MQVIDANLGGFQALSKTDLHCHLDGSVRLKTLISLAADLNIPCDTSLFGQVQSNLESYIKLFELPLAVMQSKAALKRIAYELVEDAAAENVQHIEIRFAPHLMMKQGLTLRKIIEAVSLGMHESSEKSGVSAGIILCAMREFDVAINLEVAKAVVEYQELGVLGIDFAGPETYSKAAEYAVCFDWVRNAGLFVTIHAGEAADATSIEEAIRRGHANRIGHGTHLMQDPKLLEEVVKRQIPLEMCISSNWQTRAVQDLQHHPAKALLEAGVCVTLNTDNRLISATSINHELELAQNTLGFSDDQIKTILKNGFRSAWNNDLAASCRL